ncbi:MAG: amidohydrolase family protein, partial [Firmicutes bacterium]|nr:amidohydrolase family protein [Bacillota bacterium]
MLYDALYINGKIFTSDDSTPFVEAMAVKDGKILWTGKTAEASIGEAAGLVDLEGRCVVPGFIDSHQHCLKMANSQKSLLVLPPNINSIEELIEAVARVREEQGPQIPVYGWGYEEGKLQELRTPTKDDLDQAVTDVPVIIFRTCGHVCTVNSKALELLNITSETPDPVGGKIGRDDSGQPNGILYENAATDAKVLLPVLTAEDTANNLISYGHLLASQGVTTVSDMGGERGLDFNTAFTKAIEQGFKTKVGFYYHLGLAKANPDFVVNEETMSPENQIRM